ncbi:flagellar hook assembly protein FlgD [Rhodopila sp.]|jgi:flagellar basal-body rod modification protein FlgD|uniref:flagellar hook assembly protein FlgD n=1 Tax=Rhodopila sp. TaxID=2480087 RepID=UPI002BB931F0|nr:flagellar hook capping FlgD N-terminal domain-containing protein [Rhodopila sp.]HVZ08746.1 flagellar hook capping FlgD N-terminal domain-containing protein [Rhodopila sp.]
MSTTTTTGSATSAASSASSAITQTGTTALTSLTSNFNDFLTMLMTQLQHQDPTQPMDASQFTSELVQFSSVEQQIATNTNLTQLITLTQASQIEQSSDMIGKKATVSSSQLVLQNGSAQVNFTTPSATPVVVSVYNSAGTQIQSSSFTSNAGANTWTWDGKAANGVTQPDGAYKVAVSSVGSDGSTSAVSYTVTGTVTSVQNNDGTVTLQMGGLSVPFSSVQSVDG